MCPVCPSAVPRRHCWLHGGHSREEGPAAHPAPGGDSGEKWGGGAGRGSPGSCPLPLHPPGSAGCRWRLSSQEKRDASSFQGQGCLGPMGLVSGRAWSPENSPLSKRRDRAPTQAASSQLPITLLGGSPGAGGRAHRSIRDRLYPEPGHHWRRPHNGLRASVALAPRPGHGPLCPPVPQPGPASCSPAQPPRCFLPRGLGVELHQEEGRGLGAGARPGRAIQAGP